MNSKHDPFPYDRAQLPVRSRLAAGAKAMATAKPTMVMTNGATKTAVKSCSSIFSTPGNHLHVDTESFQIVPPFEPSATIFCTAATRAARITTSPQATTPREKRRHRPRWRATQGSLHRSSHRSRQSAGHRLAMAFATPAFSAMT